MITPLTSPTERIPALAALLADTVNAGASVGFLAFTIADAADWWRATAAKLGADHLAWVAHDGDRVLGTIQLVRAAMPNSRHRADIAKLMVHPGARGRGLARELLKTAERAAVDMGVTLLVLDTETGSAAERLYASEGWARVGDIPDYALDAAGTPRSTTVFCKRLVGVVA